MVWESYKFYVQRMTEDSPDDTDPTLSLEKNDLLGQAYYNYARDGSHFPESYRVLKALYEWHIEGKNVRFHRYAIIFEEREEVERDKKLPSYTRTFAQDASRSKCINMLHHIRNPRSSVCFKSMPNKFVLNNIFHVSCIVKRLQRLWSHQ